MIKKIFIAIFIVASLLNSGCSMVKDDNQSQNGEAISYSFAESREFREVTSDGFTDIGKEDSDILNAVDWSLEWFEENYSFDYNSIDIDNYENEEREKIQAMIDGELIVNIDNLEISHCSKYEKDNENYVALNYHIVSVMDNGTNIYFADLSSKEQKNITRGYKREAYGIIIMRKSGEKYEVSNFAHVTKEGYEEPHIPEMIFGN